jgi:hypothetical protein
VSTSASFVVVGVVMVGVVLLVSFVGFISAQTRYQPAASFTFLAAVVVAAYVAAPAYEYVNGILEDKLQSSSFTDRSGSDELSYAVFLDTFGWGVGLGNGRASSFVATLFSTVGFVGVLLFLAAVAAILGPALRIRAARPVIWVLAASLIGKVVSGPDLSSPDGLMWMCLGVLASMVLVDRRAREHAAAGARAQADGTEPLAAATSPPLAGLRRPRPRHAPAHR